MDDFRERMTDEISRLVLGGHFDRFLLQCMYCRLNRYNFWTSCWILDFLGSAPIFVTMIYIFFLVNFFLPCLLHAIRNRGPPKAIFTTVYLLRHFGL